MVAFALVTALPVRALADEEIEVTVLSSTSEVEFDDGVAYFSFTPTESAFYTFSLTATAPSGGLTSYVVLYVQESLNNGVYRDSAYAIPSAGETGTGSIVLYLTAGQTYYILVEDAGLYSPDNFAAAASTTISVSSKGTDITSTGSYKSETLENVDCFETCLVYTAASTGVYKVSAEVLHDSSYNYYCKVYVYDEYGNYVDETSDEGILLAGDTTYYIRLICYRGGGTSSDLTNVSLMISFSIALGETSEVTLESAYEYETDGTQKILSFTATAAGTYTFAVTGEDADIEEDDDAAYLYVYFYDEDGQSCGEISCPGSFTVELEKGETVYLYSYSLYIYSYATYELKVYTLSVTLDEAAEDEATDDDATDATEDEEASDTTGDATESDAADESDDESAGTSYSVIEGAEQELAVDADSSLVVTADGELDAFTELQVDGTALEPDVDYTVASGSTIVTLSADYLATLEAGEHTLTFVYSDGECSTTFTILASETDEDATSDESDAAEDEAADDATSNSTDESDEETTEEEATDDSTSDTSSSTGGNASGSTGGGASGSGNASSGGSAAGGAGFASTGDATSTFAVVTALAAVAALAVAAVSLRRRAVR